MGDSNIVFDRTIELMQDRLNLSSVNQKVISGNLANLNTPGYAARETSFEEVLRESLEQSGPQLSLSNARHVDSGDARTAMQSVELVETGPVDLDTEMMKLSRNSIEYQFIVTMLNKKFSMMKHAIGEGGL
ncbi:MAG: flagellar basal body rod protein FlgB [Syntrophobacteraceae bacterium]|nr:flagellar basal body rod protein FlgB [Syntrophobacteraceae bacterium]